MPCFGVAAGAVDEVRSHPMAPHDQPAELVGDSEARFRVLADLLPQIVWIRRPGRAEVEYINARWLEYTGMTREQSLRDSRAAVHPDDLPPVLAAWAESQRTGQPYEAMLRIRRADGAYRWFLSRNAPARDAEGRIVYWLGTSTDIHERVLGERHAQVLADITERIRVSEDPDALLAVVFERMAEHLGLWRAYFAEVDAAGDRVVIRSDYRRDPAAIGMAGVYPTSAYVPAMLRRLAAGQTAVVANTVTDPLTAERFESTYRQRGNLAFVVVPLLRDGHWVSALVASHHEPHDWTPAEVSWLEAVADRAWHAVERLRLHAEHRRSEERYRAFLEHSAEGIWRAELDVPMPLTLDEDAQLEYAYAHVTLAECNDAMARMYGYERGAELQGARLGDLIPRDDPANTEYLRAFFRSGYRLVDARSHEVDRLGRRRWFLNSLVGVVEDGVLHRVWGTQRDITERQHAERDTRFLLELDAELAPLSDADAIEQAAIARLAAHLDVEQVCFAHVEDGRATVYAETRRAGPSMVGCHALDGLPMLAAWPVATHGTALVLDDAAHLGPPEAGIFARFAVRGVMAVQVRYHDRWVAVAACASRDPRAWRPEDVHLVRDVAARVWPLIEQARALKALRAADRRKDEFLAMLAHELRNPLAPIRSAVEVLRLDEAGDPRQQWARQVIDRQVQVLTRLVGDLLDVSRITHGTIALRRAPVDLRDVVRHAVETYRDFLRERGHQLTVTLPPAPVIVDGDETRLVQAVGNILHNAAKYTADGGRIDVEVGAGDDAWVRVRDNGIGIPADLLPYVFDLFTQAERSLDRAQGGLGIGLTLSRQLVALHGGTIEPQSDGSGRGTTFTVRLPLGAATAAPGQRRQDANDDAPGEGLRILIVEDNQDAAEMLAYLLSLAGHQMRTVGDGLAALDAVAAPTDVVLCDIGLPGMDGYELARRLRAGQGAAPLRLIAVSGYGRDEDRAAAREAGFDAHLTKPVDPVVLTAMLRE
jgi:PAS domain S-box-containing protein